MRAVSQPCPVPLLPRLHPRGGAAKRRPGGAGGCTPTCPGERALSQPLLLGWRRRDLRNAPPAPRSQPPWRLLRSFRDPAPPLRTALPSTLRVVAGRPHLRGGSLAYLVLDMAGFGHCSRGFVRCPLPPERCTGGRSRGSSILQKPFPN